MLRADVFGDAVNILHQFHRVLESVGVHLLHQIGLDFSHTGTIVANIIDLIGMVDVAHLDFLIGEKWAGNAESLPYLQELAGNVLIHAIIHERSSFSLFCLCASACTSRR